MPREEKHKIEKRVFLVEILNSLKRLYNAQMSEIKEKYANNPKEKSVFLNK